MKKEAAYRFVVGWLGGIAGGVTVLLLAFVLLGPEEEGVAWRQVGNESSGGENFIDFPHQDNILPADRPTSTTALPELVIAARRATPSVVHISAERPDDFAAIKALLGRDRDDRSRAGEGSGLIYRADGYVVTNYHVIADADRLTVTTSDRRSYPASLVGVEPKADLAVLRISATDLPVLENSDSDRAEPGQWVLAVGSPFGLTSTVTAGIVSATGRSISLLSDLDAIESFIQTDAAVNPGNSGGPLVDAEGKFLGINTAIASRTGRFQGYSFAIPSRLVSRIVDDIIVYGSYRRVLLGIEISTLTSADIRRLGLKDVSQGVVIDRILAGGAAARGGLLVDDVVVEADGRQMRDLPELTEVIGRALPGDTLNLRVVRDNVLLSLPILMTDPQD